MRQSRLPIPLLYLSSYLETHRREYYDRLQGVRERGEVQEWLQFFLAAVARQADDAVTRAEKLMDLRERYRADAARSRSRSGELVDLLFANPVVTVRTVEERLGVTNQGARNLMKSLEDKGWLLQSAAAPGRGGRVLWLAPEIFGIIEDSSFNQTGSSADG